MTALKIVVNLQKISCKLTGMEDYAQIMKNNLLQILTEDAREDFRVTVLETGIEMNSDELSLVL